MLQCKRKHRLKVLTKNPCLGNREVVCVEILPGLHGFHLLAARLVETTFEAVGLAFCFNRLQLRDSAGLSPVSPLSLPIRG